MKYSPAFTLIELLVVVALLAVFAVSGFSAFTTAHDNQLLVQSAQYVADTIVRASNYSQGSRDNQLWGIKSDDKKSYSIVSRPTINDPETAVLTQQLPTSLLFTNTFSIWFDSGKKSVPTDQQIGIQISSGKTVMIQMTVKGNVSVLPLN